MILTHAKQLHSMYPDQSIRDQINFIEECPIHLDVNDIVLHYIARMDNKQALLMNEEDSPF